MNYEQIIDEINPFLKEYTAGLGEESQYCFHDKSHVMDVVAATIEMADYYELSEEERFVVVCSAYFHDVGYLTGGASQHEERSAIIAEEFLKRKQIAGTVIAQIKGCILATRMPQQPVGFLQEIVCDADLFHFGGDDFAERNRLMRREQEQISGKRINRNEWRVQTIALMEQHQYHTQYAINHREAKKKINLEELKVKAKNSLSKETFASVNEKRSKTRPERGIETMFRITSSNNQRLSDMADNKANILLTVNSIILSIIVAGLFRKLDNNEHLIIPTFILISSVLLTMVLAILSTIPKIPSGTFRDEEVQDKTVNLLFFGNFFRVPFQRYKAGMEKAMEDSAFLYGMMTKDVYSQGVVLGRKYRLLRYAYGIFMIGLVLSVLTFFVAIYIVNT